MVQLTPDFVLLAVRVYRGRRRQSRPHSAGTGRYGGQNLAVLDLWFLRKCYFHNNLTVLRVQLFSATSHFIHPSAPLPLSLSVSRLNIHIFSI